MEIAYLHSIPKSEFLVGACRWAVLVFGIGSGEGLPYVVRAVGPAGCSDPLGLPLLLPGKAKSDRKINKIPEQTPNLWSKTQPRIP